ncbi:MAG: outer membrane protein assembly factor BamB [Planctomycetota bacterium]|jgi:outer membrane protein assembly factor BamB
MGFDPSRTLAFMSRKILPTGSSGRALVGLLLLAFAAGPALAQPLTVQADGAGLKGWLNWRGPDQNGTSPETGVPDQLSLEGDGLLWTYNIAGRGTPVVSQGRVFGLGYTGKGDDLQEVLFCLDQDSGKLLWEHRYADFLTDLIYTRYAIGSPTIDPATGNVFAMTSAGLLNSYTPDGELLWSRSMMEDLGRLSFPNGRTGAPLILDDQVIIHFIFASWGPLGPARDRFFSFDKADGRVLWDSTPGGPPKDSSFSMPVVEERGGRRLMYAGLGGGHIVCVDTGSGKPVWRFPFAIGGINSSCLIYGDKLIVLHGKENRDSSVIGRMACLDLTAKVGEDGVLPNSAEVWRQDLVAFTSSPVLVGNRIYATTMRGDLQCVNADTGEILWHHKLAPDQLHASPLYADGKLYVPMTDGGFTVVRPSDEGPEILSKVQLEGSCLGAPALSGGRILIHTTEKLYCLGERGDGAPVWRPEPMGKLGAATRLQVTPHDVTVRIGQQVPVEVSRVDALGHLVEKLAPDAVKWDVPSLVETTWTDALMPSQLGVGVVKAGKDGLAGSMRVRVVPRLPHVQTFDQIELNMADGSFAFPPGYWFGGRPKWKVVDLDGERVVTRNMSNPLFQRTMSLAGHPDDANYTMRADIRSEGNRRSMSSVGLIHQRYLVLLKGNHQELEISSNMEHLKVSVPFKWKHGHWYTMLTRVDAQDDGSAIIRAKVWPKGEAEPEAWTTEVTDPHGHTHGAWGLYGFTPQSRFSVYLDNLSVTPNE